MDIPQWSEASSIEEEYIKCGRKIQATSNTSNSNINVDIPQWSEASSSEEEYIKCSRKSRVETVNEVTKEKISEVEDIGIRKCRRRSRVEVINKEVKEWTSLSKNKKLLQK